MERLTVATQHLKPERAHLVSDLIAGLTFAVVNVPQAMGHALLATINPVFGIYTLMIAVPVGALFTSSVVMNVSTTSYRPREHLRGPTANWRRCQPGCVRGLEVAERVARLQAARGWAGLTDRFGRAPTFSKRKESHS